MSQVLLVIDVQESFRHTLNWSEDELPFYLQAQNRLIAGARLAGVPVIRIFHVEGDAHFSLASGLVRCMEGSDPYADLTIEKHVNSALMEPALREWLAEQGIRRLIISGMRMERCCETTARHGCDLGFEIDFVTEASYTTAHRHTGGRLYSASEIRERTELVLHQRFATIRTVDEMLDRFEPARLVHFEPA